MVDVGAISAAATSFKVAVDLAKGVQALTSSTEVREKTSALLDAVVDSRFKLLEASEAQTALLARIDELEKKIANFEDWNSEKQRYELKQIDRGGFAYMHKTGMEQGEPRVWFCQNCFEQGHKASLQLKDPNAGKGGSRNYNRWACNRCKGDIVVRYTSSPAKPFDQTPSPA